MDIMVITSDGIIIRCGTEEISKFQRATQGVRVMKLDEGVKVVSIEATEKDEEDGEDENSEAEPANEKNDENKEK